MPLNEIKALIFDCDGVLVDSEVICVSVEMELLAQLGLKFDLETYLSRFVGLRVTDYLQAVGTDYYELTGKQISIDFPQRLHNEIWPRIQQELKPIEGVRSLISLFDGVVAVASSSQYDRLIDKLTITSLLDLFHPNIYSADQVSKGKPSPDLFLHTAKKIGVYPHHCAVIEDSVNGILACRAAGMLAIGFVGGGHADPGLPERLEKAGAQFVARTLPEVSTFLNL